MGIVLSFGWVALQKRAWHIWPRFRSSLAAYGGLIRSLVLTKASRVTSFPFPVRIWLWMDAVEEQWKIDWNRCYVLVQSIYIGICLNIYWIVLRFRHVFWLLCTIVGLYGVSLCLLMPSVLSIGGFGELSELLPSVSLFLAVMSTVLATLIRDDSLPPRSLSQAMVSCKCRKVTSGICRRRAGGATLKRTGPYRALSCCVIGQWWATGAGVRLRLDRVTIISESKKRLFHPQVG